MFLGPKAERYHSLLLIISWSERLLQYAIFLGPSVRSFWGILSQNLMKNGQDRAKIRSQIFFVQIQANSHFHVSKVILYQMNSILKDFLTFYSSYTVDPFSFICKMFILKPKDISKPNKHLICNCPTSLGARVFHGIQNW